jgi:hypothetical protein
VNTFRDTNYWVTPLWGYDFAGFFQPVDNAPTLNVAKAGSAIPVKFSLGGNQGLDIFQTGYPRVTTVSCSASAPEDVIESTVMAGRQLPAVQRDGQPVQLRLEDQLELGRDVHEIRARAQRWEHAHLPGRVQEVIDPGSLG